MAEPPAAELPPAPEARTPPWFYIKTSDCRTYLVSRGLMSVGLWQRRFGRGATMDMDEVARVDDLPVYAIDLPSVVFDEMHKLLILPATRLDRAVHQLPPALKAAGYTFRDWLDLLDYYQMVPADEIAAINADGGLEPATKKARVFNPYEQRLHRIGQRVGAAVIAHHPDAGRFASGQISVLTITLVVSAIAREEWDFPYGDPDEPAPEPANFFARFFRRLPLDKRSILFDAMLALFPAGCGGQYIQVLGHDPKSTSTAAVAIDGWPVAAPLRCFPQSHAVYEIVIRYA
jgi:hypothetical protein